MIKSINLWSFPGGWQPEQCFEAAAAAGFGAVEPNFALDGYLTPDSTDRDVLALKARAEACGLALASLSTGVYWACPPTSGDAEVRAKALELVKRQLEIAALLGVGAILVVPGMVGAEFVDAPPVRYDVAYDRALDFLRAAAPHAAACGVVIGVENVWNKFLLSPLEMAAFVDACESPFVQSYFDVGNVLQFGYPEQWIDILGKRIVRVHVKDFKCSVGNINGFTDLLTGDVNFPAVVEALRRVGYDGYLTAELSAYRYYSDQLVPNTSAALDRIIAMN